MSSSIPPDPHHNAPAQNLIRRVDSGADHAVDIDELDQEPIASSAGSLSAYLHAFRRRWFVALALGGFCAAAVAFLIWSVTKDQYTATVVFRVAAAPETLIFNDAASERRVHPDDFEIFKNTQQQLIRTDYVIKAALRPEAVNQLPIVAREEDPDRWLAEEIKTRFPNEGELMNLSVPADSARETAS
jgi:hypothetical protein